MLIGRGIGRVGRPGLIGTVARTAVVAGTATAVVGGMSRHQQQRAAQAQQAEAYREEQLAAQQQPPTGSPGGLGELDRLVQMHDQGALSDDEFTAAKAKLLGL